MIYKKENKIASWNLKLVKAPEGQVGEGGLRSPLQQKPCFLCPVFFWSSVPWASPLPQPQMDQWYHSRIF